MGFFGLCGGAPWKTLNQQPSSKPPTHHLGDVPPAPVQTPIETVWPSNRDLLEDLDQCERCNQSTSMYDPYTIGAYVHEVDPLTVHLLDPKGGKTFLVPGQLQGYHKKIMPGASPPILVNQ